MPQKKYDAFKHASHNLKAHNVLKKAEEFPDWEVTTAFYSCLKFFEGSLFPCEYQHPTKDEKVEYKSYNEYRSAFNRFVGGNPHDAMKFFVKNNTDEDTWLSYKELYDTCHDSRYKNYVIHPEDLKIAQNSLATIKAYCIENQK
ncbi:MAG: hypothetical protein ABJN84_12860 [Flavobacteriaceae bacterium]